jgi:hypothetical protein
MSTFIIRNQGFFYTDEYFAPGEVFKQVVKKTFRTRAAAEKTCAALVRKWVRSEPIGNYVFDDRAATDAIWKYLRAEWPGDFDGKEWLSDVEIPEDATDEQVDAIVKRMSVTFAQVFEVEEDEVEAADEDEGEDGAEDEEADYEDELHYGPND